MGDRVSIQFAKHQSKDWIEYSAVLHHHWGGQAFPLLAKRFVENLQPKDPKKPSFSPTDRLEPSAVMIDFIGYAIKQDPNHYHSMRAVPTSKDCDNSDNGHFVIWLDDRNNIKIERRWI